MGTCRLCGAEEKTISEFLGLCLKCIREKPEALEVSREAHARSRARFGLPAEPPRAEGKGVVRCRFCGNECGIPSGGLGYCGLTKNEDGKLVRDADLVASFYFDAIPTNCVAQPFCAANGFGYPEWSCSKDVEVGFANLSIFCVGCAFDCLFCQNWHFREEVREAVRPRTTDEQLLETLKENVSCICWFGGDPAPQLDKVIRFCRLANERVQAGDAGAVGDQGQRVLRYCIETCGNANPALLRTFAKLACDSGGGVKFDLKFFDPNLSLAVSGVSNKQSYKLFESLRDFHASRREVPFLTASTLMLPGYVDDQEIKGVAEFVAGVDESIPYSLLGFFPHFEMQDLPLTKKEDALRFQRIAQKAGLKNVRIGNVHLLR